MNKTAMILALTIMSFAMFLPFTNFAQAQNYTIENVNHSVQLLYSGHMVITDTIQITGQPPENLLVAFPYRYGGNVLRTIAYDSNNKSLTTTSGLELQDHPGFYATSINLPAGTAQPITVIFILSNNLLTVIPTGYSLDFPAYPTFTTQANTCNVEITLPTDATNAVITKSDGNTNSTTYATTNLPAYGSFPANINFTTTLGSQQLIDITELNRQVNINPTGAVTCTDTYRVTSKSVGIITSLFINAPPNAKTVTAKDELGRTLSSVSIQTTGQTQIFNVTLILNLNPGHSTAILLDYTLPSIAPTQPGKFTLNFDLIPYINYYVNKATVTIQPPEGATITTPQLANLEPESSLKRDTYQESLSITRLGVTYIDSTLQPTDIAEVTYSYSPLWTAFRPTSWVWAAAVVGCVIAALWVRPRGKVSAPQIGVTIPKGAIEASPDQVVAFVEAFEERDHLLSELRSLEVRAQRGRIPRRRYRVQRTSLEQRLNVLDRQIANLKAVLSGSGGSLAGAIRELEAGEVEMREIELASKTLETRHVTGELPLEDFRREAEALERRKQKVEAKISGVLLRLRQEVR